MHLQDAAKPLVVVLTGVVHRGAGVDGAGIDPEESQLAHKGVGGDLKCQSGEGLVVGRMPFHLFLGLGIDTLDSGDVGGGGHIVDDGVEQLLHALVLIGRAAGHGHHGVGQGGLADAGLDLLDGQRLAGKILLQQGVVLLRNMLQQLLMIHLRVVGHIGGDLLHPNVLAQIVIIDVGFHFHQVDDALEGILGADGQLDRHGVALEPLLHHVDNAIEIGAHDVHLIDVGHAGNLVLIRLTPHGFRLGFHTALGAEHGDGSVEHAQGALHLDGEVHVAGGVDDIDAVVLPEAGGGGGSDGDAALLLLRHPVHGGAAVMGFAEFMIDTGIEQDTLGRRRFAGVDVRHDTDISGFFQRDLPCHKCPPFYPQ